MREEGERKAGKKDGGKEREREGENHATYWPRWPLCSSRLYWTQQKILFTPSPWRSFSLKPYLRKLARQILPLAHWGQEPFLASCQLYSLGLFSSWTLEPSLWDVTKNKSYHSASLNLDGTAGANLWWSPGSKLRCLMTRTAPQTSSLVSVSKVSTCKSRSLCLVAVQLMLVSPVCHGPKVSISLTHLIQFFLMALKGHANKKSPLLTFSTGES